MAITIGTSYKQMVRPVNVRMCFPSCGATSTSGVLAKSAPTESAPPKEVLNGTTKE